MCTLGVYTIKLRLLYDEAEHIRRFEAISISDALDYEQVKDHIEKAYRGSPQRRVSRIQETVRFMERQQSSERPIESAGAGSI